MTENERPYWFPVVCDKAYIARLREDYPENAHMSDDELHDYYNHGLKYQNLWDHVGDAYSDYEPLADAFLELLEMAKWAESAIAPFSKAPAEKSGIMRLRKAIAKAEGRS